MVSFLDSVTMVLENVRKHTRRTKRHIFKFMSKRDGKKVFRCRICYLR